MLERHSASFLFAIVCFQASATSTAAPVIPETPAQERLTAETRRESLRIPDIQGTNVTQSYQSTWDNPSAELSDDLKVKLRKFRVLIVPGFLSDAKRYVRVLEHPFGGKGTPDLTEYFAETVKWLKDNQIDYAWVHIQAEQSPEYNAKIIDDAVKHSPRPAIVLSHSKGGVDTLVALLTGTQIAGWISLDAPFFGSPVADLVADHSATHWLAKEVLTAMGGSEESLESLKVETRIAFMQAHEKEVSGLIQDRHLPMISFAGWKEKKSSWKFDTIFKWTRDIVSDWGYPKNDGIVPLESQVLPGSDYIIVEGIDHLLTVRKSYLLSLDRPKLTQTLLSMIVEKIYAGEQTSYLRAKLLPSVHFEVD